MNIRQITLPLYEAKGWMRFFAVVSIILALITGVGFAIINPSSEVGFVIGVLTAIIDPSTGVVLVLISGILISLELWAGMLVFQAANKIDSAYIDEDTELLVASLKKLKIFFILNGVLMLMPMLITIAVWTRV